ncbi:MAG: methylmalonyl-CoA mutase family protein [Bacteroidota bacterium]|nr:methylmalonyl-CoA mutase family protein [Bacteroidota bacterium]MDX5506814.1 methylmalonyl-CoA mutase family protein [Bacteroidota bacterium]
MSEFSDLFNDFPPTSFEEWKTRAEKDLKGKPLSELEHQTSDGIEIHPYYDQSQSQAMGQPIRSKTGWTMFHEILVEDAHSGNLLALKALNWGASGLLFYVHDSIDLHTLLKDVMMEHIRIDWVVEGDLEVFLEHLKRILVERGLDQGRLQGSINHDPVENALRTGKWRVNRDSDMAHFNTVNAMAPENYQTMAVNGNLYQNAGATSVQQLAFMLSQAHEYLVRSEDPRPERIWFNVAVGSSYFEEIAKLRALRVLWRSLLNTYELGSGESHIHVETTLRNKSLYDPHNNLLRTTTEGMSAVIGGCDSLSIKPYSLPYRTGDIFADRLALNQQLIFEYESYLGRVRDVAGGSYFIEQLTTEMAEHAWTLFKELESEGGILNAIGTGKIQSLIEGSADEEQKAYDNGEIALLGMNLYPNREEKKGSMVQHHLVSKTPEAIDLRPVVPRRLSEMEEEHRLASENQTA